MEIYQKGQAQHSDGVEPRLQYAIPFLNHNIVT